MQKQLRKEIEELFAKIKFIERYNLAELQAEHREKVLNSIKACNLIIDLILARNDK